MQSTQRRARPRLQIVRMSENRKVELARFRVRVKRIDGRDDVPVLRVCWGLHDEHRNRASRHQAPLVVGEPGAFRARRDDDEIRVLRTDLSRHGFVQRMVPHRFALRFEAALMQGRYELLHLLGSLGDDARTQRLVDRRVAHVAIEHRLVHEVEQSETCISTRRAAQRVEPPAGPDQRRAQERVSF